MATRPISEVAAHFGVPEEAIVRLNKYIASRIHKDGEHFIWDGFSIKNKNPRLAFLASKNPRIFIQASVRRYLMFVAGVVDSAVGRSDHIPTPLCGVDNCVNPRHIAMYPVNVPSVSRVRALTKGKAFSEVGLPPSLCATIGTLHRIGHSREEIARLCNVKLAQVDKAIRAIERKES
jgi:hypothetical protein